MGRDYTDFTADDLGDGRGGRGDGPTDGDDATADAASGEAGPGPRRLRPLRALVVAPWRYPGRLWRRGTRPGRVAAGALVASYLVLGGTVVASVQEATLQVEISDRDDTAANRLLDAPTGDDAPAPSPSPTPARSAPSPVTAPSGAAAPTAPPALAPGDTGAGTPTPAPAVASPTPTTDTHTVVSITDGDTLRATGASGEIRVRLAQVDAPETGECYGSESTAALQRLSPPGATVVLRRPGPPFEDRFGRTLAEILRPDGSSVSVELVAGGFAAFAAGYADEDPDLAARLRAAEEQARAANAGLWGACGGPHRPAAPPPPPPSPEPAPAPPPSQQSPWGGSCHPAYDPCVPPKSETGDLDCSDIRQHYPNGVRVDHAHGDPHGLDRDGDGHGCE